MASFEDFYKGAVAASDRLLNRIRKARVGLGTGSAAEAKFGAAGSPEARAFRASQAPAAAAPAAAPASRAGNFLRAGGRVLGAAAAPAVEAVRAGKNIAEGENPVRSIGRGALRAGGTMLGAAGGSLLGPIGTIVGGVGGYAAADKAASYLFGDAPNTTIPAFSSGAPARAATPDVAPSVPQGAGVPGLIPTQDYRGGQAAAQTPEQLIQGNAVPVRGTGAFQVTRGDGQVNPAQGIDLRSAPVTAGPPQYVTAAQRDAALLSQADARTAPRPDVRAPEGVFGEMAAGVARRSAQASDQRALRASERALNRGITVRGQDLTAQTARGNLALQARAAGTKAVDDFATTIATTRVDPNRFKDGKGYEPAVTNVTAKVKSDLNYTLGRRGLTAADFEANPRVKAAMQLGVELKARTEAEGRSGFFNALNDYFGQKRFNSRDLGNYTPQYRDGNTIYMASGETVDVTELAGGKFNLLSPNEPIDKDIEDLLLKLPPPPRKGG